MISCGVNGNTFGSEPKDSRFDSSRENQKTCSKCGFPKDINDFSFKNKAKDRRQDQCKNCHKEYCRSHYSSNKKYYINKANKYNKKVYKWVTELKTGKSCTDCKQPYPHYILDFDYLHDKEFNIANKAHTVSRKRLVEELEKCELVCANRHRTRTWNRSH